MKQVLKKMIVVISLIIFSGQALALKCGHRLVNKGDAKAKVYSRCGSPDYSETRELYIPQNCNQNNYVDEYGYSDSSDNYQDCYVEIIDVLTYNFGPRKFMRELVFIDGILRDINSLGYGY
jgi:hypothetical protein